MHHVDTLDRPAHRLGVADVAHDHLDTPLTQPRRLRRVAHEPANRLFPGQQLVNHLAADKASSPCHQSCPHGCLFFNSVVGSKWDCKPDC